MSIKEIGKQVIITTFGESFFLKIRAIKRRLKIVTTKDKKKIHGFFKSYPEVLTINETIDWIVNNKASISRYGDGEFEICLKKDTSSFQNCSKELSQRLIEVLKYRDERFMVCIPPFNSKYNNGRNFYGILSFWEYYWLKNYEKIKPFFKHKKYGNSFISRSNLFYESDLEKIKQIWMNRKVVFVYGNNGRFEIKSELFGNVKKYEELKVAPKNAFDQYDSILKKCLEYDKDYLFLLAIGQTATVLAYDLYKNGFQAIDIGHFPNSYDEYLGKISSPEKIPIIKGH